MDAESPESLVQRAVETAKNAYAPFSKFHVGAAVVVEDGSVFTGCNVENSSYGLTICAERNAIFAAAAAGHRKLKAIAIVAKGDPLPWPCGACRQVIAEFAEPDCPIYVASADNPAHIETSTLGALLPHGFRL